MSFYLVCSGMGEQIGGQFLLPPSIIHIPRFQGNTVTLPAGLAIKGGRGFEWALLDPVPPGVIGITNKNSATPIITFDLNTYAGGLVQIKCFAIGNPLYFATYTLNTNLFSSLGLGFYAFNQYPLTPNSVLPINVRVTTDATLSSFASEDTDYVGNYFLVWGSSGINEQFLEGYLVEGWNPLSNNWVPLATTNSVTTGLEVTDYNTSYRVTSLFNNNVVQARYPAYSQTQIKSDRLVFAQDVTKLNWDTFGFNVAIAQTENSSSFFTEVLQPLYTDTLSLSLSTHTFDYNLSSTSNSVFYTELVPLVFAESSVLTFFTFTNTYTIDQTPSVAQFWVVQSGV